MIEVKVYPLEIFVRICNYLTDELKKYEFSIGNYEVMSWIFDSPRIIEVEPIIEVFSLKELIE